MIKTPQTAHIQPHPFNPSNDRQVRGVCACDLGILTSSRDKTAKVWAEEKEAGGRGFALLTTLVGHTGYVGPVAFIAPGARDDLPNGAVVTGALPGRAMMRGAANGPPVPLSPQQQSVRAPSDPHPTPLSLSTPLPCTHTHTHTQHQTGSFDATVRVWDPVAASELAVLKGHQYQVAALAVLAGGEVASASVDK